MERAKYALEEGSPKRIEVSWKFPWRDLLVQFDGRELGRFRDQEELSQGRELPLPDGSTLCVWLEPQHMKPAELALKLFRNGKPLPGTSPVPETPPLPGTSQNTKMLAIVAVFWMAIRWGLSGLLALFGGFQMVIAPQWGIAVGVLFAFLGLLVKRGEVRAVTVSIWLTAACLSAELALAFITFGNGPMWLGLGLGRVFSIMSTGLSLSWMADGRAVMKGLPSGSSGPGSRVVEILSCPQCSALYRTSDYRADADVWHCSYCNNPLPRRGLLAADGTTAAH